jgi:PAS domain-containing protein
MSDSSNRRRRRRTGSTSARFTPSQHVLAEQGQPAEIDAGGIVASGAVAVVALALVALIWIVNGAVVQDQGAGVRERAERNLIGQAATIAETVSHEFQMIEQSLSIIQSAWKQDSDTVDLIKWQKQMPALTSVADDLFIADDNRIIRQDILSQAVGQGVGAAYGTFAQGLLEAFERDGTKNKDSLLLQGQRGLPVEARHFLMYVVRPLDHPRGWTIGASYRSTELTRLFAQAALGFNAVVALVDTQRATVQSIVGSSARKPITDLSKTPLYAAMTRVGSKSWLGPSGLDTVERLHAFHRVGERDLMVVVAANWIEVMEPANTLAAAARILAGVATALVIAIAGVVSWALYASRDHHRRERISQRNKSEIERLRIDEAANALRAQLNSARLQLVIANVSDGVALIDSSLRLTQWNDSFARGIGIALRQDMPLDTVLREQVIGQNTTGLEIDTEAEVARRIGILHAGAAAGLAQRGPDGETLILRALPVDAGGLILLLNGFAAWQPAPAFGMALHRGETMAPQPLTPVPIDW